MTWSNGNISAFLAIRAGNHRSPVTSQHKGQRRGALMFSSICAWINGWVNNCESGDLRRHRHHFDVTLMFRYIFCKHNFIDFVLTPTDSYLYSWQTYMVCEVAKHRRLKPALRPCSCFLVCSCDSSKAQTEQLWYMYVKFHFLRTVSTILPLTIFATQLIQPLSVWSINFIKCRSSIISNPADW